MTALLDVRDLRVEFETQVGRLRVIDGVSFAVGAGEIVSLVGESGCGKSMTALAILGLVPQPAGHVTGGQIVFQGEDLLRLKPARLRQIRGAAISMIFQEPMTSLNPVYSVGEQIAESLRLHRGLSAAGAHAEATRLLEAVHIPEAARRVADYPHQFSGGMRQRVMIAMALACEPKLIIADEPTTALDVTVQSQIFDLIDELRRERGTAIIFITHDMGAVAEMADRVVVMYAGRKVEEGPAEQLLERPLHPYTRGLLDCRPQLVIGRTGTARELGEIPGVVPPLHLLGEGCAFSPRCARSIARCSQEPPPFATPEQGRSAACWLLTGQERGIGSPA
jgi:peptide/nickel transport system ATP-binding protein